MHLDMNDLKGKDFIAPFLGAFCSFCFMRITEYIKEFNDMLKMEKKSLTRLEREMLIIVPRLHGNVQILQVYRSSLLAFKDHKLFEHTPDLFDADIRLESLEGIRNLDIVNDAMQMNIYMSFCQKALVELRDQMRKTWKEIADNTKDNVVEHDVAKKVLASIPNLIVVIDHLSETTQELIGIGKGIQAQIRLERSSILFKDVFYRAKKRAKAKIEHKIADEIAKMERESKEIEETRKTKPLEGDQVLNAFKNAHS